MDDTHTPEEWRPIVGHEGAYEVSDHGRVRSLDRIVHFPDGRKRRAAGRQLKPWLTTGYPTVGIPGRDRNRKVFVHVLVLESFVGPRPDGAACCHNDGNKQNNHLINLRWDTYSENNLDLVRHGTHFQASKTHCSHGHEYTAENTRNYTHRSWKLRYCRKCAAERGRANSAKRKQQRADRGLLKPGVKRKTHCLRGHEFTAVNTYVIPGGKGRQCKSCNRIRAINRSAKLS